MKGLIFALSVAGAFGAAYNFNCAEDTACSDYVFGVVLGAGTTAAERFHVGCTLTNLDQCDEINSVAPTFSVYVDPSSMGASTTVAASNDVATFTVADGLDVVFISEVDVTDVQGTPTLQRRSGLVGSAKIATVTAGDVDVVAAAVGDSLPNVYFDCASLVPAGSSGTLSVTLDGVQTTYTCSDAIADNAGNIVKGIIRLEGAFDDTLAVTLTAGDLAIAYQTGPDQRTEFAADYVDPPVVDRRVAATAAQITSGCTDGARACTITMASVQHIVFEKDPNPPPPPVTECTITCAPVLGTAAELCPGGTATSKVTAFADAACASGAVRLSSINSCTEAGGTGSITCLAPFASGSTQLGAQGSVFVSSVASAYAAAVASGGAAAATALTTQLAAAGYAVAQASFCADVCAVGTGSASVSGQSATFYTAACLDQCVSASGSVTVSSRRQSASAPVIVCSQSSAADQRLCFQAAVCAGKLRTSDTCVIGGSSQSCPACPVVEAPAPVSADDSSDSKKGLWALLGLLLLIPLIICICVIAIIVIACMRRRRRKPPVTVTQPLPPMPPPHVHASHVSHGGGVFDAYSDREAHVAHASSSGVPYHSPY